MYIKASIIPDKVGIAKSTLFKLIHDQRVRVMMLDKQFYIYWPDLHNYLQKNIIPETEKFLEARFSEAIQQAKEEIDPTQFFHDYGLDARKWNPELLAALRKGEESKFQRNYPRETFFIALLQLQKAKKEEFERLTQNLNELQTLFLRNHVYIVFKMRYPQHPKGEKYLGITIKQIIDT